MDKNLTKLQRSIRDLSPIHKADKIKKFMFDSKNNKISPEKIIKANKNVDKAGKILNKSGNRSKSNIKNQIQSNKSRLYNEQLTDNSPRSNISSPEKMPVIEESKSKKDNRLKYPKNINEYRHIMSNFQTVDAELSWILDLRTAQKMEYKGLKDVSDVNPRFYADRIAKFKKEMTQEREKKKKDPHSPKGNSNIYKHLIKKRLGGTANATQFGFETTLRQPFETHGNNSNWKGTSFCHKPRLFSSYLPQMKKDKFETMMETKYSDFNFNNTLKAWDTVYDEIMVGGQLVKQKKLLPSKTRYSDFLGEHNGMEQYDYKYERKNINEIRHILSAHTNSSARFELSLRSQSGFNKTRLISGEKSSKENLKGILKSNNEETKEEKIK